MAKLAFYNGCMSSGKTLELLSMAHNYQELGYKIELFKPVIDTRSRKISSRIGVSKECLLTDSHFNFHDWYINNYRKFNKELKAIFVDEAQFLTEKQIEELAKLVDVYSIDVFCFGLRLDYMGHLFAGSKKLLEMADHTYELKTLCKYCGSKATHNILSIDGVVVTDYLPDGEVLIGDEEFQSVCRKHFVEIVK